MSKPSQFDAEVAEIVLSRMRDGETLKAIARDENMPTANVVWRWTQGCNGAPASWASSYARARLEQANGFAADIIEIADTTDDAARAAAEAAVAELPDDATDTQIRRAFFYAKKRSLEERKLMIDARKWAAARMHPSKWGDRVTHDHSVSAEEPMGIDFSKVPTETMEKVLALQQELNEAKQQARDEQHASE
jgi:hypothetical protein